MNSLNKTLVAVLCVTFASSALTGCAALSMLDSDAVWTKLSTEADLDEDATVSWSEYDQYVRGRGQEPSRDSFDRIDTNGDGRFDRTEFLASVERDIDD